MARFKEVKIGTKTMRQYEIDDNRQALGRIQTALNRLALAWASDEKVRDTAEMIQKEINIILDPFRKERLDDILKKKQTGRELIVDDEI